MDVLYFLIPLMIVLGLLGVGIFIWSVRSGQYDDLEGDANRILMDDDDPLLPKNQSTPESTPKTTTESLKQNKTKGVWPDAD